MSLPNPPIKLKRDRNTFYYICPCETSNYSVHLGHHVVVPQAPSPPCIVMESTHFVLGLIIMCGEEGVWAAPRALNNFSCATAPFWG